MAHLCLAHLPPQDPLPSCLVHLGARSFCQNASGTAEGAAQLMSPPCRERSCSVWRRAVGNCTPAPLLQPLSSATKIRVLATPILDPSLLKVYRCLCKLFSMNWASFPSPGGGVCFPDSTGISVCVGDGNHAGEGRKPRTTLQKYFKLGVPRLFFFYTNCC